MQEVRFYQKAQGRAKSIIRDCFRTPLSLGRNVSIGGKAVDNTIVTGDGNELH
jgi:hypothetical protein